MQFSTKLSVAAAFAAVANAALTVNSPAALIQCQPVSLSWSGSTAGGPYFVSLIPGGQASAAPLADLGEVAESPLSYTVAVPSGTSVTIRVVDASGNPNYSDPITVQAGSSDSCLTGGSASGSASGASESGASMTGSQSGSASPTASGGASASATNANNGASALTYGSAAGVAGIIAVVMGVVA